MVLPRSSRHASTISYHYPKAVPNQEAVLNSLFPLSSECICPWVAWSLYWGKVDGRGPSSCLLLTWEILGGVPCAIDDMSSIRWQRQVDKSPDDLLDANIKSGCHLTLNSSKCFFWYAPWSWSDLAWKKRSKLERNLISSRYSKPRQCFF